MKKFLQITSPYIKLDAHFKERFDLIKNDPSIYLHILFGKNEDDFYKSVNSDDLEYFKSSNLIVPLAEFAVTSSFLPI